MIRKLDTDEGGGKRIDSRGSLFIYELGSNRIELELFLQVIRSVKTLSTKIKVKRYEVSEKVVRKLKRSHILKL